MMVADTFRSGQRMPGLVAAASLAIAVAMFDVAAPSAYVGDSFMRIPGVSGGWQGEKYKNWIRVDASYWKSTPAGTFARRSRSKTGFSLSTAPRQGADALVISVDKHSPALAPLLEACARRTPIPEVTYAESSDRARILSEIGPRPAEIPEFFEYTLKDVQVGDCPVAADAPAQAFVLGFRDIQWLNYRGAPEGSPAALKGAALAPASSGKTKAFVVTWFAVAHDVSADQCPVLNTKPSEADYYALMSTEDATRERTAMASKSAAVSYENEQMAFRGPNKLNACMLPGIVRDPGNASPQTKLARGLDLDGDDGRGVPPAGVCKHKNYESTDGRTGIDNQLFSVQGCMAGHQGHKGFLMQYRNEQRRNGLLSMLVVISGIDDERHDDSVEVTLLYSKDPMAKNASGTQILADYSFRVTNNIEYTHYFTRLRGRIVNGVVVTDPVGQLQINPGIDPEHTLYQARMRVEFMPDGAMKAVVGGYQDWGKIMALNGTSNSENLYGFQCPAMYGALKRAADGLKDPVTGECNGISSAYDIEGVPAFIPPAQYKVLAAGW